MKIELKKIKVLHFRNDWFHHILQKLQKAVLQLFNTPIVPLY